MMRIIGVRFLTAIVAIALASCSMRPMYMTLTNNQTQLNVNSVAVVSVGEDETDVRFAELLTRELQKQTKFKVVSQQELARRFPPYPITIHSFTETSQAKWGDRFENLSGDSIKAATELQRITRTDHIIFTWVGKCVRDASCMGMARSVKAVFNARTLKFPGAVLVANSEFTHKAGASPVVGTYNDALDRSIAIAAEEIAKSIVYYSVSPDKRNTK